MKRNALVWDWPVRLFHFCFAVGWLSALAIALWSSHLGTLFPYHSLIGLGLGWIVSLRIAWGLVGTRPARFGDFAFGPRRVAGYLGDAVRWRETRFLGHNPGSAWVIFAMIGLTIGQVLTGLAVGSGWKNLREIHEWIAYGMIGLIAAHLLGVVLHTIRHREWIGLSMVDGHRIGTPEESIRSARPLVGAAGAILIAGFCYGVYRNYDAVRQTTRLPIVGIEVRIGESEEDYD